jgi:hypothetical protein
MRDLLRMLAVPARVEVTQLLGNNSLTGSWEISVLIRTIWRNFSSIQASSEANSAEAVYVQECLNMRVYPRVSGLAVWNENGKWYSSLPLGAVVLLFCESV